MDVAAGGMALVERVLRLGVDGLGPLTGAREVAEQHFAQYGDRDRAADRLLRAHERIVGASGFATGLGGLLTLPVTIPTDIGVLYVYQARLSAGIAHLNGYDIDSEEVRSVILLSLLGSGGAEVAKQVGIDLADKAALQALRKVPGKVFIEINKKVGFRLITREGAKGVINVVKVIPMAGGLAGAGINVATTRAVAKAAHQSFPPVTTSPAGE